MPKFYITGLYHTSEFNDDTLPALEVEAMDTIGAITGIGATVWTEEEFMELREMQRKKGITRRDPIPVKDAWKL